MHSTVKYIYIPVNNKSFKGEHFWFTHNVGKTFTVLLKYELKQLSCIYISRENFHSLLKIYENREEFSLLKVSSFTLVFEF